MADECEVPKSLQGGITTKRNTEIHKGNKYNPKKVGGWGLGQGDHNLDLEVPDCD